MVNFARDYFSYFWQRLSCTNNTLTLTFNSSDNGMQMRWEFHQTSPWWFLFKILPTLWMFSTAKNDALVHSKKHKHTVKCGDISKKKLCGRFLFCLFLLISGLFDGSDFSQCIYFYIFPDYMKKYLRNLKTDVKT